MAQTIQLKRRVGSAGAPASLAEGEPAVNDISATATNLYIGGQGGGAAVRTLISPARQIELTGAQVIQTGAANAKTFDLTNLRITGGSATSLLGGTAAAGVLDWVPLTDLATDLNLADKLETVAVSLPLTGNGATTALALTMASTAQITTGTDTTYPVSSAGLKGALDGVIGGALSTLDTTDKTSIINAINEVYNSLDTLDLGINSNASLTGDGTTALPLAIAPASAAQVTAGTDNIQAVTPLRLREVTGELAQLDTTHKTTLVGAINDVAGAVATLQSGVTLIGTYNVSTNTVNPFAGSPFGTNPGPLPLAAAGNKGWYAIVSPNSGAGTGNAPPGPMAVGDQLMSNGTTWDHIVMSAATVAAANVSIDPISGMTSTTVQDTLSELHTNKLATVTVDGVSITGTGVTGSALTVATIDGGTYP